MHAFLPANIDETLIPGPYYIIHKINTYPHISSDLSICRADVAVVRERKGQDGPQHL